MQESNYIYFITERPFNNRVKIGISADPEKYLKKIQIGNLDNPNKLYIKYTGEYVHLKDMEKRMLDLYTSMRIVFANDWFHMNEEQLYELINSYEELISNKVVQYKSNGKKLE